MSFRVADFLTSLSLIKIIKPCPSLYFSPSLSQTTLISRPLDTTLSIQNQSQLSGTIGLSLILPSICGLRPSKSDMTKSQNPE